MTVAEVAALLGLSRKLARIHQDHIKVKHSVAQDIYRLAP
jgi:hypothetical protein